MEFLVLGPLEVRRDGQPVDVRGSKRRALLALLILHANEVVRTDRLVDELWGERPPANAPAALQNHVSRLRKDLGGDVLVTKPWGYVLRTEPDTIDLQHFERLVAEARTAAASERRDKLAAALLLWRGSALADVAAEPALAPEAARLDEVRLSALEQRIDTDLELGGNPELVPELEALVAQHPLRERLRGQLILALYRAGRQAEALETYRETRRVLIEELGIEPSPELRELERAILRQDPALVVAPAAAPTVPVEPPRWQWPRSPLVAAAIMLLLAAGVATAALVARSGGPEPSGAAAPPGSSRDQRTAPATTDLEHPIVVTTTSKHEKPQHPRKRRGSGGDATTPATTQAGTTTSRPKPRPPAKPATTTTRTQPTTTATTTRKPADRPWVYWIEDDFEDPALNWLVWRPAANDGVSVAERGGRLEFSIDAQAVPRTGAFGASYTTLCTFGKDFDVRFEYELLTWPPRNGAYVFVSPAFQGDVPWTQVGRKASPSNGSEPERYSTSVRGNTPPEVPTADTRGTLRITRSGRSVTTYYRASGSWVPFGRGYAAGVVRMVFGVVADAATFGGQPVVVALDNVRVTAPDEQYSVGCEGVPYPPRRPPP